MLVATSILLCWSVNRRFFFLAFHCFCLAQAPGVPWFYAVFGGVGGICSRTITAPLERVKILAQTGQGSGSGTLPAAAIHTFAAHASYFYISLEPPVVFLTSKSSFCLPAGVSPGHLAARLSQRRSKRPFCWQCCQLFEGFPASRDYRLCLPPTA